MADNERKALSALAALQFAHRSTSEYFGYLLESTDPFLRAGAWCALLEGGHLSKRPDLWDELLSACSIRAVRMRAFEFFETEMLDYDRARRVAAVQVPSAEVEKAQRMEAHLRHDAADASAAAGRIFLATGDRNWLLQAAQDGREWGAGHALEWLVRLCILDPANSGALAGLLDNLHADGPREALATCAELLFGSPSHQVFAHCFAAAAHHSAGRSGDAIRALEPILPALSVAPDLAPFRPAIYQIKAEAEERLGQFHDAFTDFSAMNGVPSSGPADPEDFYRSAATQKELTIPVLPQELRGDVVQMLGFPRSGTTLLENVLAAHAMIETFEEIPSLRAALDVVRLGINGLSPDKAGSVELYLTARNRYYEVVDRAREKPGAKVLVDKMPFRSSEAGFVQRVFPDWRYIFSIRHPFDVVLSCFKQRFLPISPMENFRSISKAMRIYDYTMTEWFSLHTLSDVAVRYVRYENLVNDFERMVTDVLAFLGLEWDESVREFATAAQARASRTPSYRKVRQGIGIGVQTYWRDYKFVFDIPEAKPLFKWAEFFGYPTA